MNRGASRCKDAKASYFLGGCGICTSLELFAFGRFCTLWQNCRPTRLNLSPAIMPTLARALAPRMADPGRLGDEAAMVTSCESAKVF